jgi:hypothetical protein
MSDEIGSQLPPPLRFEFGAHPRGEHVRAVLLLTADADGLHRVAVLAPGEISVRDGSHISIKIAPQSLTCANLKRAGQAALWCVLDAAAYCIRGAISASSAQASPPDVECFELTISSVLRDFRPDAPMVSGPSYKRMT